MNYMVDARPRARASDLWTWIRPGNLAIMTTGRHVLIGLSLSIDWAAGILRRRPAGPGGRHFCYYFGSGQRDPKNTNGALTWQMSAIPQVILLRQVKSLTASINSKRHPSYGFDPDSSEESLLHVRDPPRVHTQNGSDHEDLANEYRSYRLSVKAIRDELPRDEELSSNIAFGADKNGSETKATGDSDTLSTQDREQEKMASLLQVDPSCWIALAESGMYQRAEDTLSEAAKVEMETNGTTDRYCSLMHAIGALYDRRSYEDLTGQRCELSYQSTIFASQALAARRGLLAACLEQPPSKAQAELIANHKEKLASSLALVGQSYCNFALDGASKKLTAKAALIQAEMHLREALAVREEMNHRELAEAEKGMGYLYYCRGSVLLQIPPDKRGPYEVEPGDNPESLYLRALPFYFRSLSLYIERDGELVETSVRMTCNVAQVYQHLSVSNANYIEQAYQWYKLALERQEEAFGAAHQRTRRIKADLKDLEARKRAFEANQEQRVEVVMSSRAAAEEAERAAEARKVEADQLMDQFLAGLREERKAAEQARRSLATVPKQHSASEL
jgi:hypothetical protein